MSSYLAERDSAAWAEAWAALIAEFGDPVCSHAGESWQYMGTEHAGGRWTHCFRHRHLPGSDTYIYRHYPASPPEREEAR